VPTICVWNVDIVDNIMPINWDADDTSDQPKIGCMDMVSLEFVHTDSVNA
jgi:hypothetical protein